MGGELAAAALAGSAVAFVWLATRPPEGPASDLVASPSTPAEPSIRNARRRIGWPSRSPRVDFVQGQLADAMVAIAAGSRSGLSLPQAIALAGEQVDDPIGGSLRAVSDRVRLGASLQDALEGWRTAAPVPDVRLAAAVLGLHRRTGGALAPVLEGLARTLRQRRTVAREIRSLTAQARLSGAILGLLPVGFFGFLWLTSRRDMAAALASPFGRTAIGLGLVLEVLAFAWIRHLLRVER